MLTEYVFPLLLLHSSWNVNILLFYCMSYLGEKWTNYFQAFHQNKWCWREETCLIYPPLCESLVPMRTKFLSEGPRVSLFGEFFLPWDCTILLQWYLHASWDNSCLVPLWQWNQQLGQKPLRVPLAPGSGEGMWKCWSPRNHWVEIAVFWVRRSAHSSHCITR